MSYQVYYYVVCTFPVRHGTARKTNFTKKKINLCKKCLYNNMCVMCKLSVVQQNLCVCSMHNIYRKVVMRIHPGLFTSFCVG